MKYRFVLAALVLTAAAAGRADTLTIQGANYGGIDTVFVTNPIHANGHDNSYYGVLDGSIHLPTLYCVNIEQFLPPLGGSKYSPPVSFTVNVVHVNDEEAWLARNAKTVLAGDKPSDIDAATQLAIWELIYPHFTASSNPKIDQTYAASLLSAGAGHSAYGTEYIWTQPPGEKYGQSFLSTPSPAAVAPFLIGLVGVIRRRASAQPKPRAASR